MVFLLTSFPEYWTFVRHEGTDESATANSAVYSEPAGLGRAGAHAAGNCRAFPVPQPQRRPGPRPGPARQGSVEKSSGPGPVFAGPGSQRAPKPAAAARCAGADLW